MDCIFCKIINGEIPCYKVYEDDLVIAYLDINPKGDGHTLIVPKNHTLDLDTIDNDTLMHVMDVARTLKKKLEDKLNIDGLMLLQNNGLPQEVKHYHLHLIPVYKDKQEISNVEDIYKKIEE